MDAFENKPGSSATPGHKRGLDAASVLHLRLFALHLALILLSAVPALLAGPCWPSVLGRLALTFGTCASGLGMVAASCRQAWPGGRLCLWDEVAALGALSCLCSALARGG